MGICTSSDGTAVAPITTAKLILTNGELREFATPVKAAHVLQKGAEFFICDADEMEFGGFVSGVPDDGELGLGQIYFVLPRSMLRHALRGEDLAVLAVTASSALVRSAAGGGSPLVFLEGRGAPARRTARRRVRGRRLVSDLSAILE